MSEQDEITIIETPAQPEPLTEEQIAAMYPRWKYHHKERAGRLVKTPEQEAELGEGWVNSPADIVEPTSDEPTDAEKLAQSEAELKAWKLKYAALKGEDPPADIDTPKYGRGSKGGRK